MARSPVRSIRHFQRYSEIVQVFLRHGFGELLQMLELSPYLPLRERLLRRRPATPSPLGPPVRLRLALEELGPTFIKLGQVLSTRPDLLPAAYVAELSKLQDRVPPEPWQPIREQIETELEAPLEELFIDFNPEPIAAASLSQVHAAILPGGEKVVVKVQRPNIRKTIETDLEILFDLADLLQDHTPLGEIYDLPAIAQEFATTLRAELDFYREARNADRLRENFATSPFLYIPKVYWDFTTRRVLVLERIRGVKIDDLEALDAAGYDRSRIALHAARIIVKEVLEDGFFHADPHPGNFVVMPGEIVGAMDFGMVGHLSPSLRTDLIRLYIAVLQMDEEGIVDQLIRMGVVGGDLDRVSLRRDITRVLHKYYGLPIKAIRTREVFNDVMPIAFRHHLQLPSDLWLLGKTLSMMEGLARSMVPDFNFFAVFEPYIRRFLWQLATPRNWGPSLLREVADWGELLSVIPRAGSALLTRAQRGELSVTINHEGLDEALTELDLLTNRLSLSVLLAALIVGLALIIPAFQLTEQMGLTTILVVGGFIGTSLLGLWLIISIWRSRR